MHHGDPHQVSAIAKPDKILKLDGISPESVEAHWALYEGYVKKYNEIQDAKTSGKKAHYKKLRDSRKKGVLKR